MPEKIRIRRRRLPFPTMRIRSALFLLLVLPAAAQAAYAPKLAVKIDPATPNQPVSIVSTITQASGETPNKTVKVSFPAGYTTNLSTATICTPEQEAARA